MIFPPSLYHCSSVITSFIFLCFFTLLSCDYFKQDVQSVPVARVNDSYLYEDDIWINESISSKGTGSDLLTIDEIKQAIDVTESVKLKTALNNLCIGNRNSRIIELFN